MATAAKQFRARGKPQRKDKKAHPWYNLRIWRHPTIGLRAQQLSEQPLCKQCGKASRSMHVDHITPFRTADGDNWELFIDQANHQTLCHACHSRKTITENPIR